MLTLFFAIVFIAELIIAAHIIDFIVKCDKKVCEINSNLILVQPKISKIFLPVRIALNTALLNINKAKIKIAAKKEEYKTKIIKAVITSVLFLALNMTGKRAVTIAELTFSIRDFIKSLSKLRAMV